MTNQEDYDERRNSFEAFGEWFNIEVRSLEDIENNGEDYDEVIKDWCDNNNHEIREDGIYNLNFKKEKEEEEDNSCDCCCKSWNIEKPNEFGVCECFCSNCGKNYRDCKYECFGKKKVEESE